MDNVIHAFTLVASFETVLALVFGTLWGIVVGALPGLGSVLAITICLPFTYTMHQVPAIAMLLAIYGGSVYGGMISAILINTPGTPQSAATCFDGYPMSQRGEADKALGWSTIASIIGGLLSCIVLIFAAPQLAAFALQFGPIETFALILLGLTCIASISRGSMFKGLLAGVLGLFMAMVGADPITGDLRFTFGSFELSGGFSLIPVVVGIFALSEVFDRIAQKNVDTFKAIAVSGIKLPTWTEYRPRIWVTIKSFLIGTGVGILPGTGAATAAFLSYAEAKRSSPRRDNMGHGEPDGLVASEASNNAVTGGALIPTLALGIPGDAVTAVMLATLTIHGITPGVRLMHDNPDVVYASFLTLILANLCLLPFGYIVCKLFARILKVPEQLMLAMIVIFCLLGAYGVRSSFFDLWVALAMGMLGMALRYMNVSLAALVIGLVLGPQFEMSLRQGLVVTDGRFSGFFTGHPIAMVLFCVTILMICWPLIRRFIGKGKPKPEMKSCAEALTVGVEEQS
ncbi:tripartite tricarboxylate transporter permease [Oceanidesulfovibrio marinus]|uniref:tripartite tricarboxylate transporter permease n=1 Tax=Oceanidesulfovibrio marinus TaxID=370038 RepID=UPI00142EE927|nr:tripartite tricarboxylate transporter permease [Oceanidesulfovibrio marinus]